MSSRQRRSPRQTCGAVWVRRTAQQLEEIKKTVQTQKHSDDLTQVIQKTPSYSVEEYLRLHAADKKAGSGDYRVGGLDVLDITVYEEADLSRKAVRISTDGYISFPLIGRLKVDNLTTSEVENLIAKSLADGPISAGSPRIRHRDGIQKQAVYGAGVG